MTDDLVRYLKGASRHPYMDNTCNLNVFKVAEAADRIEAQAAEIERLKNKLSVETEPSPYCPICGSCGDEGCCGSKRCMYPAAEWQAGYEAGIEAQAAEIEQWRECALYDATMEGPVFKGWDRSALERCRRAALEARGLEIREKEA
jgi:uncharacterized small protein (DUF1192 family)